MSEPQYEWRGAFDNDEVNTLHADAFGHRMFHDDWRSLVDEHSLGWVTARREDDLVGFVNVVWDGLVHVWIQDEMVSSNSRRSGIGVDLISVARDEARSAGCEWLHVDFDDDLRPFYYDAAGFMPTNGGLIDLTGSS